MILIPEFGITTTRKLMELCWRSHSCFQLAIAVLASRPLAICGDGWEPRGPPALWGPPRMYDLLRVTDA